MTQQVSWTENCFAVLDQLVEKFSILMGNGKIENGNWKKRFFFAFESCIKKQKMSGLIRFSLGKF